MGMSTSSTTKKNLVSTYLKGIDSQLNKKVGGHGSSILASSQSGHHPKMIGTSRNNQALIAPAGTKNKVGGGAQIHTALVNL